MKTNKTSYIYLISAILLLVILLFSVFYFTKQINNQKNVSISLTQELNQANTIINNTNTELSNTTTELVTSIATINDLNDSLKVKDSFENQYALAISYINLANVQAKTGQTNFSDGLYYDDWTTEVYNDTGENYYDYTSNKETFDYASSELSKCKTSVMRVQKILSEIDRTKLNQFWKEELNLRDKQLIALANVCNAEKALVESELTQLYAIYVLDDMSLSNAELKNYNEILIPAENKTIDEYLDIQKQLNVYWNATIYEVD